MQLLNFHFFNNIYQATLDSVVQSLTQQMAMQLSQQIAMQQQGGGGSDGSGGNNGMFLPPGAHIQFSSLQVPPPPFTPPYASSPSSSAGSGAGAGAGGASTPLAADKDTNSAKQQRKKSQQEKKGSKDNSSNSKNAAKSTLPGKFFKGLKRRSTTPSSAPVADDDVNIAPHKRGGKNSRGGVGVEIKLSNGRNCNHHHIDEDEDEEDAQGDSDANAVPSIDRLSSTLSASGRLVITTGLFEDFTLEPPRDLGLRQLWDRLLEEEVGGRILRMNRRAIHAEMRRNGVKHAPGAMRALEQILRRQVGVVILVVVSGVVQIGRAQAEI